MTYFWSGPAFQPNAAESVEAFSERVRLKHGLTSFRVYEDQRGFLRLDMIEVPRGSRGEGVGSRAMEDLVAYADERKLLVHLTPALRDTRHGTTSRRRLVKFYKRFGFVENKGRHKDFTLGAGDMYRVPRLK